MKSLRESLINESATFPSAKEWIIALKDADSWSSELGMVRYLKGKDLNPKWLSIATRKDWENFVQSEEMYTLPTTYELWSRLLKDITPKSLADVIDWAKAHWSEITSEYDVDDATGDFADFVTNHFLPAIGK